MEHSIRSPLTKLLNGSTNYVSCPTALLISPKLTVHDIVSAFHEKRAIISEAPKYLFGIGDEDESFTTRKEHQKMKLMSSHLLSSSNDLAYFL